MEAEMAPTGIKEGNKLILFLPVASCEKILDQLTSTTYDFVMC